MNFTISLLICATIYPVGQTPQTEQAALPPLIKALKAPGSSNRIQAIEKLAALGVKAEDAIPFLVDALGDELPEVSTRVPFALAKIGPPALPPLILTLGSDKNVNVKLGAIIALKEIKDTKALPFLLYILRHDKNSTIRASSAWAPGSFSGQKAFLIPHLIHALTTDTEANVQNDAAQSLVFFGDQSVPYLRDALSRPDGKGRGSALWALHQLGPSANSATPEVLSALKDPDESMRILAAMTLENFGPTAKGAVPGLEKALNDPSPSVRIYAAGALFKVQPTNPLILQSLSRTIEDKDPDIRGLAATQIGRSGLKSRSAVSLLLKALKDPDFSVRKQSVIALGELGPAAASAVPALKAISKNEDSSIQLEVTHALSRILSEKDDKNEIKDKK